jgi:uncharacterized protein YndB with AHSA1/START domain
MTIERSRWYPEPPDVIWGRMVPATLVDWIGDRNAVVDEVVDGELLVFTWEGEGDDPVSQVEIRVEGDGDGTRVTVVERALESAPTVPIGFQPRASASV